MNPIYREADRNRALDILVNAFYCVPGVMWMIRKNGNRRELLRKFLSFCLQEASDKGGAFLTGDRNGVVFFYRLENKPRLLNNFFLKLYIIFMVLGVRRTIQTIKTRKMLARIRPATGWYAWFVATDRAMNGTRAAYEIKNEIFRLADASHEPIFVETTLERIASVYSKIGFRKYAHVKHPYEDIEITFMRRDPRTGDGY